jgi:hypothetical protein
LQVRGKNSLRLLDAVRAEPIYHHVFEVRFETIFFHKAFLNIRKYIFVTIQAFTTGAADQMMMMTFLSMVIDKMTVYLTFNDAAGVL